MQCINGNRLSSTGFTCDTGKPLMELSSSKCSIIAILRIKSCVSMKVSLEYTWPLVQYMRFYRYSLLNFLKIRQQAHFLVHIRVLIAEYLVLTVYPTSLLDRALVLSGLKDRHFVLIAFSKIIICLTVCTQSFR